MRQQQSLPSSQNKNAAAIRRIALGAGIAIVLMIIFISSVKVPDPSWGSYWYIRPIIVIAFAGAAGGAYYHFVAASHYRGWRRGLMLVSCLIVYIVGLWLGSVIGLNGTLWD